MFVDVQERSPYQFPAMKPSSGARLPFMVVRAFWILGFLLFGVLLSGALRLAFVAPASVAAVSGLAVLACVRPAWTVLTLAALIPSVSFVAARLGAAPMNWPEALVVAASTGWCLRAAVRPRDHGLNPLLGVPVLLFTVLILASCVVSLAVVHVRAGSAFPSDLWLYLSKQYVLEGARYPDVHAALLLLESLLLYRTAATVAAARTWPFLRPLQATLTIGAVVATCINLWRLSVAAQRAEAFWSSLAQHIATVRLNVPYGDLNAAGSYFAMCLLIAAGLALSGRRRDRFVYGAATAVIAAGLWISGSRAAMLSGAAAAALTVLIRQLPRASRARALWASAAVAAAIVVVVLLLNSLPGRGNQKSTSVAVLVRLGLVQTSIRMIASHPVFGIGLGQFTARSGEFSSPDLLNLFPPAVHENAHNNFLQIAAELGIAGGAVFIWIVGASLWVGRASARRGGGEAAAAFAGLTAFVLTWLAGHPLLIPEPAFAFWILLGAVVGAGSLRPTTAAYRLASTVGAAAIVAVLATLPWRVAARIGDADLEHVGIGVSGWQRTGEDLPYRIAVDYATLFVPTDTAFRFQVKPLAPAPVYLELRLDGRVADVVLVVPGQWNRVTVSNRNERPRSRFSRLDLRVVDGGQVSLRIGKVEPVAGR